MSLSLLGILKDYPAWFAIQAIMAVTAYLIFPTRANFEARLSGFKSVNDHDSDLVAMEKRFYERLDDTKREIIGTLDKGLLSLRTAHLEKENEIMRKNYEKLKDKIK
jgi:hypothetical protein